VRRSSFKQFVGSGMSSVEHRNERERTLRALDQTVPLEKPSLSAPLVAPRRRRFFLRSLRWRLALAYGVLLTLILAALGGILLVRVSALLYTSATGTFQTEARTAAKALMASYRSDMLTRDPLTHQCSMTFQDAFQAKISDPLTRPPLQWQDVALLDAQTGAVLAPLANTGTIPPQFDLNALSKLRQKVGSIQSVKQWNANGVANTLSVTFDTHANIPGAGILIAYDAYTIDKCPFPYDAKVLPTLRTIPAVLFITRDFAATQTNVQSFGALLAVSTGTIFVLGLLLAFPLTSASLNALSRVTEAAQKLAQGDLQQRVGISNPRDEMEDLALTFDEMAARVETAFKEQHQSEQRVRQFLADASHELRTPITSIRGYLDVLARSGGNDAVEREYIVNAARREAERMTKLVSDLLTLARFDTGRPLELAWTDLSMLAGEAVDQARLLAGERLVTLHGDGEGRLMAFIDRDRIKQVVLVLLDNALKYGRQDADGWVHMSMERTATSAIIQVSDNGQGIASTERDQIFERFYRGTGSARSGQSDGQRPSGAGLGLPIARSLIHAHDGTISVTSVLGQGTTFTITLPLDGPQLPST